MDDPMLTFLTTGLKYGWPALALFLIWVLVQRVEVEMTAQTELLKTHVQSSALTSERMQESVNDLLAAERTSVDLLRQQCVNASKTPYDRTACFEAGRGH
jgi:hypothetical protein